MIRSLRVKGFRRYADETVSFGPGANFVEGENNAGKTSLLYAIEYGLFGRVDGFKTLLSLLGPGARGMGVELVFTAKSGATYRLQRAHLLPPRSRTKLVGHFTLKEITTGEAGETAEKYVLSSDFQDHDDALAQKLQELLGITRRLFQVALSMRQGDIPRVLEGAPELDIVLGVTAAVVASDELRAHALDIEKEVAALPVLEESERRLDDERAKAAARLGSMSDDVAGAKERAGAAEKLVAVIADRDGARAAFVDLHRGFVAADQAANETDRRLADQRARLAAASAKGGREETSARLDRAAARRAEASRSRAELAARAATIETERRALDRSRGDLEGRITRSSTRLEGGSPTCESCGATIDTAKAKGELAGWSAELAAIIAKLDVLNGAADATAAELRGVDVTERELAVETSADESRLADLDEAERELAARELAHQEAAAARDARASDVRHALASFTRPTGGPALEWDGADLGAGLGAALASLEATLAERRGRADADRAAALDLVARGESDRDDLASRLSEIDRELAGIRQQVGALRAKVDKAARLRRLSDGFKDLQVALRRRASVALAADTHDLHTRLSAGDQRAAEFERILVDPAKYSVDVVPKHLKEEVPAALYEGGGHRLLLGLAFKLAVTRLAGRAPFVLLDEPTYGLDGLHRETLLDRIADLGVADQMFIITHETMGRVTGRRVRVAREGSQSRVQEIAP